MKTIKNCTAKVYQRNKNVAELKNVVIIIEIASTIPAPLFQPGNRCCGISGEIVSIKKLDVQEEMTIYFKTEQGQKLKGDYFYIKPPSVFDKKDRIYFELSGVLEKVE